MAARLGAALGRECRESKANPTARTSATSAPSGHNSTNNAPRASRRPRIGLSTLFLIFSVRWRSAHLTSRFRELSRGYEVLISCFFTAVARSFARLNVPYSGLDQPDDAPSVG